jgi:hypothetical protein
MLSYFSIDESPHSRDGLRITARDGEIPVDRSGLVRHPPPPQFQSASCQ